MEDVLFSAGVPVRVCAEGREDRLAQLLFRFSLVAAAGSGGGNGGAAVAARRSVGAGVGSSSLLPHERTLRLRLTDDEDLQFLFTAALGEREYTELRNRNKLRVDFATFPDKVVELLRTLSSLSKSLLLSL